MPFDKVKWGRERKRKYRSDPEWVASRNLKVKEHVDSKRAYLQAYKADQGCLTCGERDPIVLEFNHRDPATKLFALSRGCGSNFGWARLRTEIAKCDVLCANCHRRHTAKQNGWT